jgi:hypothetical protein
MDPRRISKMLNLDRIKTNAFQNNRLNLRVLWRTVTEQAYSIKYTSACKIPEICIFSSILVNRKIRTVRDGSKCPRFCPNTLLTKPM